MAKTNPKPRRPPNNLASAAGIRKGGAAKKKRDAKGPPFRPKNYGDPETML